MKSSGVAGVELTYCRATGSVLTEPAASSRMEMSEDWESAHCNHSLEDEGGGIYDSRFSLKGFGNIIMFHIEVLCQVASHEVL